MGRECSPPEPLRGEPLSSDVPKWCYISPHPQRLQEHVLEAIVSWPQGLHTSDVLALAIPNRDSNEVSQRKKQLCNQRDRCNESSIRS